ncbi:MAG: hypothetical protein QNJ62_14095 [Methyloceanibacter sp.]|nr:hypothetical protein [Methyloceanibacter sp.]
MRAFYLALVTASSLALMSLSAQAFEIQGENADIPRSAAEHLGLSPAYSMPQFEGSSLAMPFANGGEGSGFATDYGNSIAIPAPGISQPTPAWRSGVSLR